MVSVRVNFGGVFIFIYFSFGAFNKIVIPLPLVGYEMTMANSALGAGRAVIGQFSGSYSSLLPA